MNQWQLFHTYNRLVRAGSVKPLSCPDCGGQLVTRMRDGDPELLWLWCPFGSSWFRPGGDTIEQVRAVVREHVIEEQ